MTQDDFRQLAKAKKLIFEIHDMGMRSKRQYVYDKNEPIYLPDGELNEKALKIKEVRKIEYRLFSHNIRTADMPEHQCYKINKKLYKELEEMQNDPTSN